MTFNYRCLEKASSIVPTQFFSLPRRQPFSNLIFFWPVTNLFFSGNSSRMNLNGTLTVFFGAKTRHEDDWEKLWNHQCKISLDFPRHDTWHTVLLVFWATRTLHVPCFVLDWWMKVLPPWLLQRRLPRLHRQTLRRHQCLLVRIERFTATAITVGRGVMLCLFSLHRRRQRRHQSLSSKRRLDYDAAARSTRRVSRLTRQHDGVGRQWWGIVDVVMLLAVRGAGTQRRLPVRLALLLLRRTGFAFEGKEVELECVPELAVVAEIDRLHGEDPENRHTRNVHTECGWKLSRTKASVINNGYVLTLVRSTADP